MKNLTLYFTLALLVSQGNQLIAQGHYTVNPQNINQVAAEIYSDYAAVIDISMSDILTHLSDLNPGGVYDPSMTNTTMEVAGMLETSITMAWTNPGIASSFNVAYLNMQTDFANDQNVSGGSNDVTFTNMDDAFYLMSITSVIVENGVTNISFVDVIIIEKPVFIVFGEVAEICDCPEGISIYNFYDSLGVAELKVQWDPYLGDVHVLSIEYVDSTASSYVQYSPIKNTFSKEIYAFEIHCLGNIWNGQSVSDNTLWGYIEDNPLLIHMNTEDYSWELSHSNAIIEKVTIKYCGDQGGESINIEDNPKAENFVNTFPIVYPNPAKDQLTLEFLHESWNENVSIVLFNTAGSVVLHQKTSEKRTILNIDQLPAGLYHLQVGNAQYLYSEKIVITH